MRGMAVAEHLVASTRDRVRTLTSYAHGYWLWTHLLAAMPGALSLMLMPDHIHLMATPGGLETFRRVLAAFSALRGVRFDICDVQPAASLAIAGRQIRYGLNNPVRSGFVDDPWAWPWSTLRDIGGATFPGHTDLETLGRFLRCSPATTLRGLTTSSLGRFPPPERRPIEVARLEDIVAATAAALRMPVAEVPGNWLGRRLVAQASAQLAQAIPARVVAERIGITSRSVQRSRTPLHPALDAVMTCLADPRLRRVLVR